MLFFFEEYRFASKLLKRQQQLQLALARAEVSQLPEGIVEVYRVTLAAHEAVQKEVVWLGDVVATSFGEDGEPSRGDKFAKYTEGAKALVRDIEAFEKERLAAAGGSIDPKVIELQLELEQRRLELGGERLALVRGLVVSQVVSPRRCHAVL